MNKENIGSMSFADVHWDAVTEVDCIREVDSTVIIRCMNGKKYQVQVPFDLMKGCIEYGKKQAEKRFEEQELEKQDRSQGLY